MYKLSRAESFARSKNREIHDINFREFEVRIIFASINFRESSKFREKKIVSTIMFFILYEYIIFKRAKFTK